MKLKELESLNSTFHQDNCKAISMGVIQVCLVLILLVIFAWSSPALAHKVYVFAWAEQEKVHTESSFGDRRVRKGSIEVEDMVGTLVIKGVTDDEGNFSFKIPEDVSSDLVIRLDASMGHRAVWIVPLKEMKLAMGQGDSPGGSSGDSSGNRSVDILASSKASHDLAMAQKEKLAKGPSAVKIIAGIGIIFALAFAGAWVRGRINQRRINQGRTGQGQVYRRETGRGKGD